MADRQSDCAHEHGEYHEDYQHCLDCGQEMLLISGQWFRVEGWVQMDKKFLEEPPATPAPPQEEG